MLASSSNVLGGGSPTSPIVVDLTLSGILYASDGAVGAPSISFAADTDTGFFRLTTNQMAVALGGALGASWEGQAYRVAANTALTAGGVALAGVVFGSSNNIGIFFGSGAPTISAAQGSIYLRSDGSSTSTRLYVNTTGSTTWTAVTTAA